MSAPTPEYDLDGPEDGGESCFWCAGEGWDECDGILECTKEHIIVKNPDGSFAGQLCRCASCGGSGLAKDMTIWLIEPERDLTQRCPQCNAPPGEPCLVPHQPSAQPWP